MLIVISEQHVRSGQVALVQLAEDAPHRCIKRRLKTFSTPFRITE
jgi:hypothetical protein